MSLWLLGVGLSGCLGFAAGLFWPRRHALTSSPRLPALAWSDHGVLEVAEEAARFGMWEHDSSTGWVTLSAGAAHLSGLPAHVTRVRSDQLHARVCPLDMPRADEEYKAAIAKGDSYELELRVLDADGVYRWRRNCGRVERAGGTVVRVVGALLDIDDERRLLEKLREGADRMALAEDVAGFGIWRLDLSTNVMSLSPGAAYLSGLGRQQIDIPRSLLSERIHADDRRLVVEATRRALAGAENYKADFRIQVPEGVRWVRSQGRVDRENGEPCRMTGAIIDLTREREFATELRDAAERMALAEETAGFGVWEVDVPLQTVTVSEGLRRLNGLPETGSLVYSFEAFNAAAADRDHIDAVIAAGDTAFETGSPSRSKPGCGAATARCAGSASRRGRTTATDSRGGSSAPRSISPGRSRCGGRSKRRARTPRRRRAPRATSSPT